MEFIKCKDCFYNINCPCNWSNGNAACLTIQKYKQNIDDKIIEDFIIYAKEVYGQTLTLNKNYFQSFEDLFGFTITK